MLNPQLFSFFVLFGSITFLFETFTSIDYVHDELYAETSAHNLGYMMSGSNKILISEVALDNEFIEIYNPNNHAVDLTNMYITDATFNPLDVLYFRIVDGSSPGGGGFRDFHARFPNDATIPAGAYQTISILGSDNFFETYGQLPTYELSDDGGIDDGVTDMLEAFSGSIPDTSLLSNSGEVVILYTWDGVSDLVQDVDYVVWGDKAEAIDKSGQRIDGPDDGMDSTSYLNDTPIVNQDNMSAGISGLGQSYHRVDYTEGTQMGTGGNGITGADETSENFSMTWTLLNSPTPNASESCNSEITLNYSLASATYVADMTINVSGAIIENDKAVIFSAGQEIIFSDDFEIQLGGTLETIIQTCK